MSITRVRAEAMNAGIAALAKAAQQLDTFRQHASLPRRILRSLGDD